MPVLREDSVLIMDGAIKLYRRERSRKWQAAFQIDGQYIRISTGKSDLDEAKQAASDSYLEYKFRQKNGVPVVSKRFSDVAKLCITEMNKQLKSGVGKKVYRDYVIVLEKYLIPFFGKMHVTSITYETLQKFARWREQQMGREPKASTLNTHKTLHEHLLVWDAKQQNPTAHDSELADIAGISVNAVVNGETVAELRAEDLATRDLERVIKRRKQLTVQRHLRIAEQYIEHVALGEFPKRVGR